MKILKKYFENGSPIDLKLVISSLRLGIIEINELFENNSPFSYEKFRNFYRLLEHLDVDISGEIRILNTIIKLSDVTQREKIFNWYIKCIYPDGNIQIKGQIFYDEDKEHEMCFLKHMDNFNISVFKKSKDHVNYSDSYNMLNYFFPEGEYDLKSDNMYNFITSLSLNDSLLSISGEELYSLFNLSEMSFDKLKDFNDLILKNDSSISSSEQLKNVIIPINKEVIIFLNEHDQISNLNKSNTLKTELI